MRTQLTMQFKYSITYAMLLYLVGILVPSQASALEVDRNRTIEINSVVQAPEILQDANRVLELSAASTAPIYILINSPGGSVYAGLQFINAMEVAKSRGVVFHCIVPGMAMSMAFQFLLTCNKRYALEHSMLLWHPVRVSGMMTLTPDMSKSLTESLLQAEEDLLPLIIWKLSEAKMTTTDILKHYREETLWTGRGLERATRGFIQIISDIEGMASIWNVSRMLRARGNSVPSTPSPGDRKIPDIQYIWEGFAGLYTTSQSPSPTPAPPGQPSPEGPRDCRSCHSPKPGHGGVIR